MNISAEVKSENLFRLGKTAFSRREFLKTAGIASGVALLSSCNLLQKQMRPNVVLIVSDDQAWDDYGFMGHEEIETPHLDRLASHSTLYPRGYVTAPLCCPSLASIVTGLYPHQHKITSNDPPHVGNGPRYNPAEWPDQRRQLRREMISHIDEVATIPGLLQEQGYVSFQSGKWWLGNYSRGGFTHGMTHGDMDRGGRHGDEGLTIGREGLQPIYNFIESTGDSPFFVWYAPFLPHTPHNPPDRLLEKYRSRTDSIHVARYWAMCEWFDETCGELLNYLDTNNLSENTMVLYVCDNGWIQQKNAPGYAPRSKRTPYEGGIRTPIMVRWPGHTNAQRDEVNLVSSIDIAPTILRACGIEPAESMHGVDLLDKDAVSERNAVFGAAYTHDAIDVHEPRENLKYAYVISETWKLILPAEPNVPNETAELYHITEDPKEQRNLAEQHPEKVRELQSRVRDWWPAAVS